MSVTETPAQANRKQPRATPAQVQQVIDLWKQKHGLTGPATDETRGLFRKWCYLTCQHFFTPKDVFHPVSWSVEDVRKCTEALNAVGTT